MISQKTCPECGSDDLAPLSADTDQWICRECGYTGTNFEEEPVVIRSDPVEEEAEMDELSEPVPKHRKVTSAPKKSAAKKPAKKEPAKKSSAKAKRKK